MSECTLVRDVVTSGFVRVRVLSHISLTKRSDGWLIAVDGVELLVCARRRAALRAIRDAITQELPSMPEADRASALLHDVAGEVSDHLDETGPHRRQRTQRAV